MHVGQSMNPHGFITRGLGQIVIDPGAACRLAMVKGNALAIQLLGSHAAGVFLEGAKESDILSAAALKARGENLLTLVERSAPDSAPPAAVWGDRERAFICAEIDAAHASSFGVGSRNRLIDVAEQIQAALQSPEPGVFDPIPIGPASPLAASPLTVALILLGAVTVAGTAFYFLRR